MALDGAFLRYVRSEIESEILGARIDKIYQPSKEEFVFSFRGKNVVRKLLLSTRANSARVHFTNCLPENPNVPPMLCMLFRKKLLGAKLVGVRQPGLERVLFFDFVARNELGDEVEITVVIEVMGRYSNVILIDSSGKIVDALKRIDVLTSSKRQILPGIKYKLPPKQDKLSLLDDDMEKIANKISLQSKIDVGQIADAILAVVKGLSPIVCREIEFKLKSNESLTLTEVLRDLKNKIVSGLGEPFIVYKLDRPADFSFIEINQDKEKFCVKKCENFSGLLDEFFAKRDSIDRMKVKAHDLRKQVENIISRLKKKIKIQAREVDINKNKDELKLHADLISANVYRIKKGDSEVVVENFFDENLSSIKIKLDPLLSASENASRLYREYKKSKVAVEKLNEEMLKARQEIEYLETVLDEVERATLESDLSEIKNELLLSGYIKISKIKNQKDKVLPPIEYVLSENVKVLVGRNNRQNDKLTLKMASKNNLWFHVKDIPGSHVILIADERHIGDDILSKTAKIAAYHSKAKESSNVPVDFALVKDVKKPVGAKPGMVIYNNNRTLYVTPDENFVASLRS